MSQRTAVSVVVAVALLAVLASAATAAATGLEGVESGASDLAATTDGAATDAVSPGQRFAGVIGAQRAEVEGEIRTRTFGVRVAAAPSSHAKADVVAAEVNDIDARLDALQNRKTALERARENGSVSDGVYRARVTELVTRIETTEGRLNATDDVTDELPQNDLEAAGVRQSNITRLRQQATNLSGRETADLARSIVGDDVGKGMGVPSDGDAPGARGNAGRTPGDGANAGRTPGVDVGANASVGNGSANATAGNGTATAGVGAGVNASDEGANASVGAGGDDANTTVGVGVDANTGTADGTSTETSTDTSTDGTLFDRTSTDETATAASETETAG